LDFYRHSQKRLLALAVLAVTILTLSAIPGTGQTTRATTSVAIPVTDGAGTIKLNAWLLMPPGNLRYPAVIIAHGCNGLAGPYSDWEGANRWAAWLNQIGYAALILDSFSARGLGSICGHGATMPIAQRAVDIIFAASYLSKLPSIDPGNIAAIGFSHGGSTVLRAAADSNPLTGNAKAALVADGGRLAAVVAMYPGCRQDVQSNFSAAVFIIAGMADDWTPYVDCQQLADHRRDASAPVMLKLYPNATHAFDEPKGDRVTRLGHYLRYDEAATTDAKVRIKAFLAQYLTHDRSRR
jgi:dienelactone hydrolase